MRDDMTKYKAERILLLMGTYDFETLNRAYRARVSLCHPDAGGSADDMIEINAAKAYLDTYFSEDRQARVQCSREEAPQNVSYQQRQHQQAQPTQQQARPTRQQQQQAQPQQQQAQQYAPPSASDRIYDVPSTACQDAADAVSEFADFIGETMSMNGSEKDAPFYQGSDYTAKDQESWTQEDWAAFRAFQPSIRFKDDTSFATSRLYTWKPIDYELAEAGNVNVSSWKDDDWIFYWLTNARHRRDDGQVYTRMKTEAYFGPYAERARARKLSSYRSVFNKFESRNGGDKARTPYGVVSADTFERMGWVWNVGMPFAYAACTDYDQWLDLNLEAQREATKYRKDIKGPLLAETPGWTGRELDDINSDEDKAFIYGIAISQVKEEAQAEDARQNPGRKLVTSPEDLAATAASWNARLKRAATAAYRNMGFDDDVWMRRTGNGKAYYNRNRIPNAPGWYNALSAILNVFPWRIAFWALMIIFGVTSYMSAAAAGDTAYAPAWLLLACVLGIANSRGFVTNYLRGFLRGCLDGLLKIWAKSTGTIIDWEAARDVA